MKKRNGITYTDFTDIIKNIQKVLTEENNLRVEKAPDTNWDLVKSLVITPTTLIIETESTTMLFEDQDLNTAKIRRRRKSKDE